LKITVILQYLKLLQFIIANCIKPETAWVLKEREEQRLEAAQMKFLRHLLGITKLDKEKNQCIRGKTGAQNIVKEIKQYQEKWVEWKRNLVAHGDAREEK